MTHWSQGFMKNLIFTTLCWLARVLRLFHSLVSLFGASFYIWYMSILPASENNSQIIPPSAYVPLTTLIFIPFSSPHQSSTKSETPETKIPVKSNIQSQMQREGFDYFKQLVGNVFSKGLQVQQWIRQRGNKIESLMEKQPPYLARHMQETRTDSNLPLHLTIIYHCGLI